MSLGAVTIMCFTCNHYLALGLLKIYESHSQPFKNKTPKTFQLINSFMKFQIIHYSTKYLLYENNLTLTILTNNNNNNNTIDPLDSPTNSRGSLLTILEKPDLKRHQIACTFPAISRKSNKKGGGGSN